MIDQNEVLNPILYGELQLKFGQVKVTHRGEAMKVVHVPGTHGRLQSIIKDWGEMYRVNCPFCDDTGLSLAVSHRFGQRMHDGRPMKYAAFCNRAQCLSRNEIRDKLFAMLSPY